ncbi:hypothetical protein EK904_014839 [Melospiza melodia maxima]|nr:hypothetical protein EK904_014839 [Melospiza melodia maxima]
MMSPVGYFFNALQRSIYFLLTVQQYLDLMRRPAKNILRPLLVPPQSVTYLKQTFICDLKVVYCTSDYPRDRAFDRVWDSIRSVCRGFCFLLPAPTCSSTL